MLKYSYILALLALLLTSCIKGEPQNMECDILEAWVDDDRLAEHFAQNADMRIIDVPSSEEQLTFVVRNRSALPAMPINFKLSPGATIFPVGGSLQDFSQGPVTYTVISEDGQWQRKYTVDFREAVMPGHLYDFEDFELSSDGKYYVWFDKADDGTKNSIWASGNEGFMIAKPNAPSEDYPTVPEANGFDGYCVKLTTRSTGSWGRMFKKPIAAGNLFFGSFDSRFALTNTLKTTNMGIVYTKEPIKVTGYYKYTPGEVFTDKDSRQVTSRTDEPAIYAVLYLNHDAQGNKVMLHGDDVRTSPYIVSQAEVSTLPPTDEWQPFEMTFEASAPIDAALLRDGGYNLALVFSSSKTGDMFEGSVGSTLYIDKVEITFKNEE